jgi:hypothetical protein
LNVSVFLGPPQPEPNPDDPNPDPQSILTTGHRRCTLTVYIGGYVWEPSTSKKLGANSRHYSTVLRQAKQSPLLDMVPSSQSWSPLPDARNDCRHSPPSAEQSDPKDAH